MTDDLARRLEKLTNPPHLKNIERIHKVVARASSLPNSLTAIQSLTNHQSTIQKFAAAMARPSAIENAVKSLSNYQSEIGNILDKKTINQTLVQDALTSFIKSSSLLVGQPKQLSKLIESISESEYQEPEKIDIELELKQSAIKFEEINGSKDFIQIFKSLSPSIQLFFHFHSIFYNHSANEQHFGKSYNPTNRKFFRWKH